MYSPSQAIYDTLLTYDPTTGASANADSLPTAVLYKNGTAGASATVTNRETGNYLVSSTIPANAVAGDQYELIASVTVGGVTNAVPLSKFLVRAAVNIEEVSGSASAAAHMRAALLASPQFTVKAGSTKSSVAIDGGPPTGYFTSSRYLVFVDGTNAVGGIPSMRRVTSYTLAGSDGVFDVSDDPAHADPDAGDIVQIL